MFCVPRSVPFHGKMLASILARKIYHMCASHIGGIDYLSEMDELEDERIDALK